MKTYDELLKLIQHWGVHPVFGGAGELNRWIEQNPDELAQFLVAMQALNVQSVLEIGTDFKAGLARFLHDEMGWEVVSVDTHDYGHTFEGITFVTLDTLGNIPAEPHDLIIIDGEHDYDSVKHDYSFWGINANVPPKVIMFHDIAGLRDCEGARDYWLEIAHYNASSNDTPEDELKPGYHEIIASGNQRSGIGYIVLSELVSAATPPYAVGEPATEAVPPKKPTTRKPRASKTSKAKKS